MSRSWLILMMYWFPNEGATGYIVRDIARELRRRGHAVTVLTSRLHRRPGRDCAWPAAVAQQHRFTDADGIAVHCVPVLAPAWLLARSPNLYRALSFATFALSALLRLLTGPAFDRCLVTSSPPFAGVLAAVLAGRYRGMKVFYSIQDLYPDILQAAGLVRDRGLLALLQRVENFSLAGVERVLAITPGIRDLVAQRVARPEKVVLAPNFVDADEVRQGSRNNALARELGLVDTFNLVYSGNMLACHGLEFFVAAADALRAQADTGKVRWVFIGYGEAAAALAAMVRERGLADIVRFLPLQPRERVHEIYAMADAGIVGCPGDLFRLMLPSKIASIMAAGRPVLAYCQPESEIARMLRDSGAGHAVSTAAELCAAVAALAGRRHWQECADRARAYVEQHLAQARVLPALVAHLEA